MPFYRVLVHGRGFWFRTDKGVERMGFYTTRCVTAASAEQAEPEIVRLMAEELKRKFGTVVRNGPADPPVIRALEMTEVPSDPWAGRPVPGFAMYRDPTGE